MRSIHLFSNITSFYLLTVKDISHTFPLDLDSWLQKIFSGS
jgi:hypothetical protein